MVKIRLCRIGRKALPTYRIVVSDSRKTPRSDNLADLGFFNPHTHDFAIDEAEALKWLNNGAIPSDSVRTLLTKKGIYKKFVDAKIEARKAKKEAK